MELNSGRRKGEQESYTRQKKKKRVMARLLSFRGLWQGLLEGYLTGADRTISD